jgi:hypothetical protein
MSKISKDKVDKILDISDQMKDFDSGGGTPSAKTIQGMKDEENRKKVLERKEQAEKIIAKMEKLKDCGDEKFTKETLKELITIGLTALRTMQDEMNLDPTGRSVECMSAMVNATTAATKQLGEIENDKKKIELEKRKVDIKEKSSTANLPNSNGSGNILVIGSMTDALKAIRNQGFDNAKEVDAIVAEEKKNKESPGTPFPEEDK